ncbi:MAG: hypothetical protein J5634_00735 [Bacilli bacterium]|nr:hypothetical protein [Bacilli bacterium]
MNELYSLGISEETIKCMLEVNPKINDLSVQEIVFKENMLKELDCTDNQVRNIISSNPMFLSNTTEEIVDVVMTLTNYGFTTLNILFDANPYIFNLDSDEIKEYIESRKNNGESLDDIVDDLDSNPYLFNEI